MGAQPVHGSPVDAVEALVAKAIRRALPGTRFGAVEGLAEDVVRDLRVAGMLPAPALTAEPRVGDPVVVEIHGTVRKLAGANRVALLDCPDGVRRWVTLPDHSALPVDAVVWRPECGGVR